GKQRVEVRVREDSHRVGAFLRVVGDDVAGGEGQDEIAAAVPAGGGGARQAERRALGQAFQLPGVERRVGRDDNDDRAGGSRGGGRALSVQLSDGDASHHQF